MPPEWARAPVTGETSTAVSRRHVILHLAAERSLLALADGDRIIAAEPLALRLPPEAAAWIDGVRSGLADLTQAVRALGATGLRARVVTRSPLQGVDFTEIPVARASDAVEGARLTLLESLAFPAGEAVTSTSVIARRRDADATRSLVLALGERTDIVQAIAELVTDAGLRFEWAAPLDGLLAAHLAEQARHDSTTPTAHVHVGLATTFVTIVADRSILFVRRIPIGLDALLAALQRPFRPAALASTEITLDAGAAHRLLLTHGIPHREAVIGEDGLTGRDIAPLLQPSLQRLMVELRQSLRFGVPASLRPGIRIRLDGAGGALPGLASLIAGELDVPTEAAPRREQRDPYDPLASDGPVALIAAARRRFDGHGLLPHPLARARRSRQTRARLWAGAAVALAFIAFDGLRQNARLQRVERDLHSAQIQGELARSMSEARAVMLAAHQAMQRLEAQVEADHGAQPDPGSAIAELAALTPPQVVLQSLSLRREGAAGPAARPSAPGTGTDHAPRDNRLHGLITGVIVDASDDGAAGAHGLAQYVRSLSESPLLAGVALGGVHATRHAGHPAERFEITFSLMPARRGTGVRPGTGDRADRTAASDQEARIVHAAP